MIRRKSLARCSGLAVAATLCVLAACRVPAPVAPPPPLASAAPDTPPAPVRIGAVTVFRETGRAECPGEVCLAEGILDYLLVAPESGKEYESLIRVHAEPSWIHAALLALGARPGPIDPAFRFEGRGDPSSGSGAPAAAASRVRIHVRWKEGDAVRTAPVEQWLTDRSTHRPAEGLEWAFTGSFFAPTFDGAGTRYMADSERLAASVLYHGACVLNIARAVGSPYRGEDLGFEVRSAVVPPVGAEVTVIFEPVPSR